MPIGVKNLISTSMKKRYNLNKNDKIGFTNFSRSQSKPTSVYCALSGNLIKNYASAKDLWRDYNYCISYRTVRRYLKSGLPLHKLNILIKYNL